MMEKCLGFGLFLLSVQQIVNSQCFLDIELVQFQNKYNVEIILDFLGNERVCCCDTSNCENSLDDFSSTTCSPRCDTYFVLTLADCQNIVPCPVIMQTGFVEDSPTTVNISHKFFFNYSDSTIEPINFEIRMRDVAGGSHNQIDDFNFVVPFPSGNQEVLVGNRGIGTITLRYDIICFEPDACSVLLPSEITALVQTTTNIFTTALTSDPNCISTSTSTTTSTLVTNTTTTVHMTTNSTESVLAIKVMNSTHFSTVTKTVFMTSSPEQVLVHESSTSSDMAVIWMSLFVVFLLLTILAVFVIVYLVWMMKRKKENSKDSSKERDVTLVKSNALSVAPLDNPVYGSPETSKENPENVHSGETYQVLYCSLTSDVRGGASEQVNDYYSQCGPAHSPGLVNALTGTFPTDQSEPYAYETPQRLSSSQ